MDSEQAFRFQMDTDTTKLVTVSQLDRRLEITVKYAADVVLEVDTVTIARAIQARFETDKVGLIVEWREPIIPGVEWLTMVRRRRF